MSLELNHSLLHVVLEDFSTGWHLTPTLARIFVEVGSGLTNRQIADRNDVTINTVKTEVSHLLAALSIESRAEIRAAGGELHPHQSLAGC